MKNRYLFWFCTAFVSVAALFNVCQTLISLVLALAVLGGGTVLVLCFLKFKKAAVAVLLGISFSFTWQVAYLYSDRLPQNLLGEVENAEAVVVSFSEGDEEKSFTARFSYANKTYNILLRCNKADFEVAPGDLISFSGRIYELQNNEFFAAKTFYKSRNIDARGYASAVSVLGKTPNHRFFYFPQYLSKKLFDTVDRLFSTDTASFVKSLVLGKTNGMSEEFENALRRTGLSHTVSVSGLHISLLVGIFLLFSKNRYFKLLLIPIMMMFTVMVGAPQSALRAVIMQSVLILSAVQKRESDSITSVSFAACVLVFINPYCVADIGFILSFAATLGIILLYGPLFGLVKEWLGLRKNNILNRCIYGFISASLVSVSALSFTMPITAVSFNSISIIAPITNGLLCSLITLVFVLGFAFAVFGTVCFSEVSFIAPVFDFLIKFVMDVIKTMAKIPFAEIVTVDIITISLVCFVCLLVACSILLGKRKVRPWFSGLLIVASILAVLVSYTLRSGTIPDSGIRFDVLDVGQGQCIVATSGENCVVVDCGGDKSPGVSAIKFLLENRVRDIDALVLTHAHADHANGAEALVSAVDTASVYMPEADKENALFINLLKDLPGSSKVTFVEKDIKFFLGDMEITILALPEGSDENENGLVVLISDGEYDTLITGDLPAKNERMILERLPDCESYIVGHHGSKGSSSQALLNKALPELCVISVGLGNTYGHPDSETLDRINKIGASIYRTDVDGTTTFYSRQVE